MICKITEFVSEHGLFKNNKNKSHLTVYYTSGRKYNYYDNDTLPMPVVDFLTSENTVSNTVYIPDRGKVNKRIVYKRG